MPTDRDLRSSFDRAASQVEPDVQRHLHQTLRHGRRRILVRRAVQVTSVVAVIALIVFAGPAALRELRGSRTDIPRRNLDPNALRGDRRLSDRRHLHDRATGRGGGDPRPGDGRILDAAARARRYRAAHVASIIRGLDDGDRVRPERRPVPHERLRDGSLRKRPVRSLPMGTLRHVAPFHSDPPMPALLASRSSPLGPGRKRGDGVSQIFDVGLWVR